MGVSGWLGKALRVVGETVQVAAAAVGRQRSADFGAPFDVLRAVSGSAELTVEAPVEPLSRAVSSYQKGVC